MLDPTPPAHAVFSPSAASRWFECPGSIRLCADIPRVPSAAADEGSAAHELARRCLVQDDDAVDHLGEAIPIGDAVFPVTEGMAEAVQRYLDTVRAFVAVGYTLQVEVKLDLGHLSPEQFGTGDAVLWHRQRRHLVIVDLKYGRLQIDPQENPQLLSYCSGAHRHHGSQAVRFTLVVVQPRGSGHPVRQWDLTPEILHGFEADFKQAVKEASEPDAPLHAGAWCMFCPASGVCPEYRNLALRLAQAEFDATATADVPVVRLPHPQVLDSDQLGSILSAIDLIEDWIVAVKHHALRQALQGEIPTGHKLVRKNTLRRWASNDDKVAAALITLYGLDPGEIWIRKLLSPAQAEKLVGRSARGDLVPLIMRPDGDATLAPLHDKRPAMTVDVKKEFDLVREQLHDSVALLNHDDKPGEHDGTKSEPE